MAGGAGFVSDMIKGIRNNRNLKQNPYYKGENYNAKDPKESLIDPKTASPELLQEIRRKALENEWRNSRRALIAILISTFILMTIILSLSIFI